MILLEARSRFFVRVLSRSKIKLHPTGKLLLPVLDQVPEWITEQHFQWSAPLPSFESRFKRETFFSNCFVSLQRGRFMQMNSVKLPSVFPAPTVPNLSESGTSNLILSLKFFFQKKILVYCLAVIQGSLLPVSRHTVSSFNGWTSQNQGPSDLQSVTHQVAFYWSSVAQCIVVVEGFLPSEQKGIPQPFFSVFSGHVQPFSETFVSYYCINSPVWPDYLSSGGILL